MIGGQSLHRSRAGIVAPGTGASGVAATGRSSRGRHRLANQIIELIRASGFPCGHHLREQHLADRLAVSRTPIRSALGLLAERGIVEARRNQGFVVARPASDLPNVVEVPASVGERLYRDLVRDRLSGAIPSTLTQAEIGRRYSVDRLALVQTLSRLAEDGLIVRNKGRGWTFVPTLDTVVSLRDSYAFRLTLEPAGLTLPTFRADRDALERSRQRHLALIRDLPEGSAAHLALFEADAAFHEMIAGMSGNAYFLQAIQQQNRLRRLLEFESYFDLLRVSAWCDEHLAIIERVATGDLLDAAAAMRRHLNAAEQASARPDRRSGAT